MTLQKDVAKYDYVNVTEAIARRQPLILLAIDSDIFFSCLELMKFFHHLR